MESKREEVLTMLKSKILATLKWSASYVGKSDMTAGNEYIIRLKRNNFSCATKYHTNINDTLCIDDIMYCLLSDSNAYEFSRDEHEFMREFGYKSLNEAIKAYNACRKTYMQLRELFTQAELNALNAELANH